MHPEDHFILSLLSKEPNGTQLSDVTQSHGAYISNILSHFDSFAEYNMVVLSEIVEIKKGTSSNFLVLLSINYTFKMSKTPQVESSFSDYEIIGIVNLKKDYGKVLIRPETLGDKITEFFHNVEVDFSMDEKFSKKYYVLTNDETKLRTKISADFLKCIRNYEGLEIEISGQVLLVRLRKAYTVENGRIIAGFVEEIGNGKN